jgi:CRP-like cAMP-binding protein
MPVDAERLSRVPIFDGLTDVERAEVAGWLDVERFEAGRRLAHAGATEYEFLILDEGRARVEQDGRTLRTLEPGDVFGEIAFFGDGHRSADVIAETDVTVLSMFGTRFRELQMSMPGVAQRLRELARERASQD